ncbi:MAG: hypothetical protein ORN58_02610, partial [Sediminibacterium sp.]|nr:hypothetical protein [Sediminibacterium sp.]
TVVALGNNPFFQVTNIIPLGLRNVVQISAGWGHSIVLLKDSSLIAWGTNNLGPQPIYANQSIVPPNLNKVIQIASSPYGNLALKNDGTIVAWGAIGNVPAGLNNVLDISSGSTAFHSFAMFKGFKINTNVNIGGTISNSQFVFVNANFRVTYNPINNYAVLDSIFINGVYDSAVTRDSTNGYTFANINNNKTIRVVYKIPTFTITSSAGPNGTISPNGVTTVAVGSNATISIVANNGYMIESLFVNNIINSNAIGSTSYNYNFSNITSNQTIGVTFGLRPNYCNGTSYLTATNKIDTVTDGSGKYNYKDNQNCSWQITAPAGKVIKLKVLELSTESCCDFLRIYNGTNNSGTSIY